MPGTLLQSVRYVIKATVCANFGRDRVHFLLQLSVAPNLVKNRFQSEKPVRVFHTLTLTEKKSNKYISDFKTQIWTSLSCKVPNK